MAHSYKNSKLQIWCCLKNLKCSVYNEYTVIFFFINFTGYVCACPTGVKLKEDSNTTCYSSPQSILLVAQRTIISKISLDSPDFTPYTVPVKDLKRALSVDFDTKTEYMYWADSLVSCLNFDYFKC